MISNCFVDFKINNANLLQKIRELCDHCFRNSSKSNTVLDSFLTQLIIHSLFKLYQQTVKNASIYIMVRRNFLPSYLVFHQQANTNRKKKLFSSVSDIRQQMCWAWCAHVFMLIHESDNCSDEVKVTLGIMTQGLCRRRQLLMERQWW